MSTCSTCNKPMTCSVCESCAAHCMWEDPIACAGRAALYSYVHYSSGAYRTNVALEQLSFAFEHAGSLKPPAAHTAAEEELRRLLIEAEASGAPPAAPR